MSVEVEAASGIERESAGSLFRRLFLPIGIYKVLLVAFPFFAVHFLPPLFGINYYQANFRSPAALGGVWALLETAIGWDARPPL